MIIGSAIKIESTTDIQGDSATISIYDPSGTAKVSGAAMNDIGSQTYQYIWQSLNTDAIGEYCVIVSVISGAYTAMSRENFALEGQC